MFNHKKESCKFLDTFQETWQQQSVCLNKNLTNWINSSQTSTQVGEGMIQRVQNLIQKLPPNSPFRRQIMHHLIIGNRARGEMVHPEK